MNASNIHSRRVMFFIFAALLLASFFSLFLSHSSFAYSDTYRRINNQTIKYTSTPTNSRETPVTRYYHADKPQGSSGDTMDKDTYFWRIKESDNDSQYCLDFIVNNSRDFYFERVSISKINGACAQDPTIVNLSSYYIDSGKDIFFYKSSTDGVVRPADQTASDSEFKKVPHVSTLALSGQQDIYIQTKPAVTCPRLLTYDDNRWGFTAPKPTDTAQSGASYDYYFKILTAYGYDTSNVGGCKVSDSHDVRANNEKALSEILGGSEGFWKSGSYGDWFSFMDLKGVSKPLGNIVGTESAAEIRLGTNPAGSLDGTGLDNNATPDEPGEYKSSCPIEGLGWIVCPVINGLSTLNDAMWSLVSSLMTISPLKQSDGIYNAWKAVRNTANIAFVIIFLIIIFSQLSSVGITNYGIKKMLPRLVVGAILVNVSFIIVQLAVDVSNILGAGLYNVIVGQAPAVVPTWTGLITTLTTTGLGAGAAVAGVAIAGGAAAALWVVLPMAAMAALGILAALLTLLFRQAVIPVLAILAPLAFVAFLLPNTAPLFKKWQSLFMSLLTLYVTAAFVFGGARFASAIMFNENEWWAHLTALVVLALPLFSLPFLAKQGGPMLSKVSGALSSLANKAGKPINSWAGTKRGTAEKKYISGDPSKISRFNVAKRMRMNAYRGGQANKAKNSAYDRTTSEFTDEAIVAGKLDKKLGPDIAKREKEAARFRQKKREDELIESGAQSIKSTYGSTGTIGAPTQVGGAEKEFRDAFASGDRIRMLSAMRVLTSTGPAGIDKLNSSVRSISPSSNPALFKTFQNELNGVSGLKSKDAALAKLSYTENGDLQTIMKSAGTYLDLTAADTASQTEGSMKQARSVGGISVGTAQEILKNPTLSGQLSGETTRKIIEQIAGTTSGATNTQPETAPATAKQAAEAVIAQATQGTSGDIPFVVDHSGVVEPQQPPVGVGERGTHIDEFGNLVPDLKPGVDDATYREGMT